MTEDGLEGQEASVVKEAQIRDVLKKQIDQLVALGFHKTLANPAYGTSFDKPPETSFRELFKDTIRPENVEDPSNLVIVIPRLRLEDIAGPQHIEGIDRWHWYDQSLDDDLPQIPYVIEIARGEPNQDPKDLFKEKQGRMRTLAQGGRKSSFDAVSTALGQKGLRGLAGHELLAYARVHPEGFERIHGLGKKRGLPGNDYFPSLVRDESSLHCQRTPILDTAKSMAEIPYIKSTHTPHPQ